MGDNPIYEIRDERFGAMVIGSAGLEELYSGCRWTEGPVWFSDLNCLLWSDIPNERMMRWTPDGTVSVFRSPSNYVNGNTRDRQAGWSLANMAAAASPAPRRTAPSPFSPTAIRASG